jgi:hypothetical protein
MVLKDGGIHSAQDMGNKRCDVCLSYDGSTLFVYNFRLGCIVCVAKECERCWTLSILSIDASCKAIFTEV